MTLAKPLLVFDGDCHFCRQWIHRWKETTGDAVTYEPYQEAAGRFPAISRDAFKRAVHLITPEGEICSAAEAVYRTLALAGSRRPLFLYERFAWFRGLSEKAYRLVADHRPLFGFLTTLFWGKTVRRSSFVMGSRVFRIGLGVVYLIAFLSFWTQARGLVGEGGILPMDVFLKSVRHQIGLVAGVQLFPSVFWLSPSNLFLTLVCAAGVLSSLAVMAGWFVPAGLFLSWIFYLSIVNVAGVFLSFQWDVLLLEAGFLALFLSRKAPPSKLLMFMFHWLLFRVMFGSGIVKWMSGDPTWHHFTALDYHYFTQPLPTWTAWFMHQAPSWFHRFSVGVMFFVEWIAPFFIFAPRRFRHVAAGLMIGLQVLILLTGNYCFFNLLTILLCLLLIDDQAWLYYAPAAPPPAPRPWPRRVFRGVAVVFLISTTVQFSQRLGLNIVWNRFFTGVTEMTLPFHSANSYGLFAVMTTERPEIIVQGSNDGTDWRDYEFKYKPGDVQKRPRFVAPHQPRLDWQLWFAALANYQQNPWFVNFCLRLLQGSPDVLRLLKTNPFPDGPPRYVRAMLYDYAFTSPKERKETGAWWKRKEKGIYLPVIGLKNEPTPQKLPAARQ
jgi:predicted DCC family thiol-disulfide oxidoreductase YuxK